MPYILAVYGNGGEDDAYKGLVVPDVVHCAVCKPKDDPVTLEPLK
jgi:hypothetical protein